jgi:glycerol-3-phosphate dehydrogenase
MPETISYLQHVVRKTALITQLKLRQGLLMTLKTQVLIIGGGITGTAIARDLALRGVHSILIDRSHINAGASGANHGVLHSGARYIASDPESSRECKEENELLKKMAPHCIENTGGLYVAVKEDDEKYLADFPHLCAKCGVPCQPVDLKDALEMEPALSKDIIAAYRTEDSSIDPFRASFENIADAIQRGHVFMPYTEIKHFEIDNQKIQFSRVKNVFTGQEQIIEAEQVVNAAGAWVGQVAGLANASIEILFSKGSLIVTHARLAQHLLLRLRPPSDGDVLCPGGTVSILGPSSIRLTSPDGIKPAVEEVDHIINQGIPIVPSLKQCRFVRAFSGVRPLIAKKKSEGTTDDRKISRGFDLIDHGADGVENFLTVAGGKLTIFRLMAERASDRICARLKIDAPCRTRHEPLPSTLNCEWTEPGLAPKIWLEKQRPDDIILCECEMVPQSAVQSILENISVQNDPVLLYNISARSRIGKGACQGTYCGLRITAQLYDQGTFQQDRGIADLTHFSNWRWKGQRAVLFGEQLKQAELQEAMYCGLFDLELPNRTG